MSLSEEQLLKYKTVLCRRWSASGSCSYKELCDYAHGAEELRRNLNKHYYRAIRCKNHDRCQFGDECHYAHNEMELLFHPDLYKTKECNYYSSGSADSCSKGDLCSFAHGKDDLRPSGVWSRKQKKGDFEVFLNQGNQYKAEGEGGESRNSGRRFSKRNEETNEREHTASPPIRILQHKAGSSSSSSSSSSIASPESTNGHRSFAPAIPSPTSASLPSTASVLQKLEADANFKELISNRKVHLLNVVDQIVQVTVQRIEETHKPGRMNGNGSGALVTVNTELDTCSLEELNKVEIALKKYIEQVQQARKKFMHS